MAWIGKRSLLNELLVDACACINYKYKKKDEKDGAEDDKEKERYELGHAMREKRESRKTSSWSLFSLPPLFVFFHDSKLLI